MAGSPQRPADELDDRLGYRLEELDWLRDHAPEYDAIRRRLLRHVFDPDVPAFAIKYREIVAGLVAATRSSPSAEVHFRRAFREGATMAELIEAVQIAERPGGATMLYVALRALMRIESESAVERADEVAADVTPVVGHANHHEHSTNAHPVDSLRGYSFPEFDILREHDPAYDDARRDLTKWVYTPTNPKIPVKYHELISAAVLASRFYPSVESHLRRALKEGASVLEVIEALEAAAVPGGGPTLHYGLTYLAKMQDEGARDA